MIHGTTSVHPRLPAKDLSGTPPNTVGSYAAPRSRAEPVVPLIPEKDVQEHGSRKVFGIVTHPAALHRPAVLCTGVAAPTCFRSSLYAMYYSRLFLFCQEIFAIFLLKNCKKAQIHTVRNVKILLTSFLSFVIISYNKLRIRCIPPVCGSGKA